MLILYKHNRSKGSRKPVQVYEPLVWYTYEWLFIVKQGAKGVAMNSYTTEDSNISETYTCGFSECSNQHDTKQKWTSIRFQQVFMIFNSLVPDDAKMEAHAASIMRPLSRGRPRDNSAVHGASEDVPGMTYDVPGVSYPIPWTSGDCPQGVRPADGPGTHSLASTGPFSQAAVHRASGLLRFSQSQRGRIMDRKWGCPQYVRNRKLMSRSCPGNATATLLAALTFFLKNKLILL